MKFKLKMFFFVEFFLWFGSVLSGGFQAWNFLFERVRPFSFCKGHFHLELKVYGKLLKGHQGQGHGQQRPGPLCNSRPEFLYLSNKSPNMMTSL